MVHRADFFEKRFLIAGLHSEILAQHAWVMLDRRGVTGSDHLSLSQYHDLVGQREDEAEVVLHQHHCGPGITQHPDQVCQAFEFVLVESGCHLVEEDDPRLGDDGASNLEHASHPQGQRRRDLVA